MIFVCKVETTSFSSKPQEDIIYWKVWNFECSCIKAFNGAVGKDGNGATDIVHVAVLVVHVLWHNLMGKNAHVGMCWTSFQNRRGSWSREQWSSNCFGNLQKLPFISGVYFASNFEPLKELSVHRAKPSALAHWCRCHHLLQQGSLGHSKTEESHLSLAHF